MQAIILGIELEQAVPERNCAAHLTVLPVVTIKMLTQMEFSELA